ncbi:MAG: hypothetical protein J6T01_02600 [Kiritimatiellae bacterium]|nr:hypothetical protein [Kiritimatiellia bacterium]
MTAPRGGRVSFASVAAFSFAAAGEIVAPGGADERNWRGQMAEEFRFDPLFMDGPWTCFDVTGRGKCRFMPDNVVFGSVE